MRQVGGAGICRLAPSAVKLLDTFVPAKEIMKRTLPLIAAFAALLALTGCGGSSTSSTPVDSSQPIALIRTDTVVGTGADAAAGMTLTVNYSAWLYNSTAPGSKGSALDTTIGHTPFKFVLGAGQVIAGWDQG